MVKKGCEVCPFDKPNRKGQKDQPIPNCLKMGKKLPEMVSKLPKNCFFGEIKEQITTYLTVAIHGVASILRFCPDKTICCCLSRTMVSAFLPGLELVMIKQMHKRTYMYKNTHTHTNKHTHPHTHTALPGICNLFAINQSPKNVYVLYEAAVSLQIVVKTRTLED